MVFMLMVGMIYMLSDETHPEFFKFWTNKIIIQIKKNFSLT